MTASRRDRLSEPAAEVPPGTRVYAIGDSHGCCDLMRALHAAILNDCQAVRNQQPERLVAVYLGDYIDRGPDTRGLLDLLIDQALPGFECIYLMGNHDIMLVNLIDGSPPSQTWRRNGAEETLMSYGIGPDIWSAPPEVMLETVRSALPESHRRFLRALRTSHSEGGYFFAHAGIRPGVSLDAQDRDDLLWIRRLFLDSTADHGQVVVHGHTPVEEPVSLANRIGIDTGAVYGGALTALVLEGRERRFLSVR